MKNVLIGGRVLDDVILIIIIGFLSLKLIWWLTRVIKAYIKKDTTFQIGCFGTIVLAVIGLFICFIVGCIVLRILY